LIKNKILILFVPFWVTISWGGLKAPRSKLLVEAEEIQKSTRDKATVDFLWKNSEKLDRTELMYLAKLLVKAKNYKDIIKVSELGLAKNAEDAEFLTLQGKSYLELYKDKKRLEKAQESLRAAIAVSPKFEPAYLILDEYYDRQDQLSRNLKKPLRFIQSRRQLFEDLIQNRGPQALYFSKLCELDTLDGVNDQAIKNCKKAVSMNKDDIMSLLNLAQVYNQTGDRKQALTTLQSVLRTNVNSEIALFAVANFHEEDKNYSEAYKHYKKCSEPPTGTDRCARGVAAMSAQIKKWQESFDYFQRLCRKDRKWSAEVRKASQSAKELESTEWEQKLLELSINCNI